MSVSKIKAFRLVGASVLALGFCMQAMASEVYEKTEMFAVPGQSAAPQWRVRGAIGLADISEDDYDRAAALDVAAQKTIDEQVAIELGYVKFNDFDDSQIKGDSIGGDVLKLSVVGYSLYQGQHRYFFRVGAFRSDLDAKIAGDTFSDADTGFFGGFGVGFRVAPQLSVITEVNQLFSASEIDFTQLYLGLEYEI